MRIILAFVILSVLQAAPTSSNAAELRLFRMCRNSLSDYNSGNGIASRRSAPLNPRGWVKVSRPTPGDESAPTAREIEQIRKQLVRMEQILVPNALPKDLKFIVTTGRAHYDPNTKTVYLNRSSYEVINEGVLWHECGHAIAHQRGTLGSSGWTWEAGFDELFADTMALMRMDTVDEMKRNGGAFADTIPAKGWRDHEEHQLLLPARSSLGQILFSSGTTQFSTADKQLILERTLGVVSIQASAVRSLADSDPHGYRHFKDTPQTLNEKTIAALEAVFGRRGN